MLVLSRLIYIKLNNLNFHQLSITKLLTKYLSCKKHLTLIMKNLYRYKLILKKILLQKENIIKVIIIDKILNHKVTIYIEIIMTIIIIIMILVEPKDYIVKTIIQTASRFNRKIIIKA